MNDDAEYPEPVPSPLAVNPGPAAPPVLVDGGGPLEPVDLIASETTIPVDREMVIKRPGHIAWAGERGNYPGCRLMCFEKLNAVMGVPRPTIDLHGLYAVPGYAGQTYSVGQLQTPVVGIEPKDLARWRAKYVGDDWDRLLKSSPAVNVNEYFRYHSNLLVIEQWTDVGGNYWVLVTNQMDAEELEEFQVIQRKMALAMEEYRTEKARKAAEAEERQRVIEVEAREILALGKKAKDHNLFGKLHELEAEVQRLSSELKKANTSLSNHGITPGKKRK